MATLLPEGKQSFTNSAGAPLVGGKIYTYDAGTSTPRLTYQDAAATIPNTNPIILNARGEALIFWSGVYKIVLKDASDVTIWTVDGVTDTDSKLNAFITSLAAASGSSLVSYTAGGSAITRTVQAELRDLGVNVKDYGATGDGVTNDAPAFALALTAAAGRCVYFPAGTYALSSMTPATGQCRLRSNGDATLLGFNWTELNAKPQDGAATALPSDPFFEAEGICFTGVGTIPALTLKNQSMSAFPRSARLLGCTFRGQVGLVLDNVQTSTFTNCDFIQNQYGLKALSCTNDVFTNCQFITPVIGVFLTTSADDTAGRKGGENMKFVGCTWIDGVTAIRSYLHNYLWLTSCVIDYFNCGLELRGSKFCRLGMSYFGTNNVDKSARSNYLAPFALTGLYGAGDQTTNRQSGVEAVNCEFLAYAGSTNPPVTLDGSTTTFTGVAEVDIIGCRIGSDTATSTMPTLLSLNTCRDVRHDDNTYTSGLNNNVLAPWVFTALNLVTISNTNNNYDNVTDAAGVAIQPAANSPGNEKFESGTVTLPCNGTSGTNAVAYTYRNRYYALPRVVATARSGPVAVELLNVSNSGQDFLTVFLKAYNSNGGAMAGGNNVVVDVIVMGA